VLTFSHNGPESSTVWCFVQFVRWQYQSDSSWRYVWSSLPGDSTGGVVCRRQLHAVLMCTLYRQCGKTKNAIYHASSVVRDARKWFQIVRVRSSFSLAVIKQRLHHLPVQWPSCANFTSPMILVRAHCFSSDCQWRYNALMQSPSKAHLPGAHPLKMTF